MGSAGATQFTVLQVTAGPKRPAAQEVVFQPTGLRDFEGVPSLTVSRRGQSERRSMRGERSSLGTLLRGRRKKRSGECMITPVREEEVVDSSVIMHSACRLRKREGHTESVQHSRTSAAPHRQVGTCSQRGTSAVPHSKTQRQTRVYTQIHMSTL